MLLLVQGGELVDAEGSSLVLTLRSVSVEQHEKPADKLPVGVSRTATAGWGKTCNTIIVTMHCNGVSFEVFIVNYSLMI